jgi:hypothetical protein
MEIVTLEASSNSAGERWRDHEGRLREIGARLEIA